MRISNLSRLKLRIYKKGLEGPRRRMQGVSRDWRSSVRRSTSEGIRIPASPTQPPLTPAQAQRKEALPPSPHHVLAALTLGVLVKVSTVTIIRLPTTALRGMPEPLLNSARPTFMTIKEQSSDDVKSINSNRKR